MQKNSEKNIFCINLIIFTPLKSINLPSSIDLQEFTPLNSIDLQRPSKYYVIFFKNSI